MGRLPAALLAELQKTAPEVYPVLHIGTSVPGTGWYSAKGFVSPTNAFNAKPRVLSWGPIRSAITDPRGQLAGAETTVDIDDSDFEFAKIIESQTSAALWGTTADILIYDRAGNAHVELSGYLNKWSFPSPLVARLFIRPNDMALRRAFPKTQILASDFPDADKAAYGLTVPLLYGRHSSTNYGAKGMLPTIYVDKVGFRYLLCAGRAATVDTVYKDGSVVASGYSITYPSIGGRLYTLIDFTTDQVNSAITCDATGYETVGDGSGTLITRPSEVLKHLLINWVWGDYKSGNWSSSGPVDTTSFATSLAFGDDLYYEASARYGGKQTPNQGLDAIAEICEQFCYRAFWKSVFVVGVPVARLALLPDDNRVTDIYKTGSSWFRYDRDEQGRSFSLEYDDKNAMGRVMVSFAYGEAAAQYFEKLTVQDTGVVGAASDVVYSLNLNRSRAAS